jgi:hypothetical protein
MDAQRAALAGGRMPLSSVDLSMGRKLPEVAAKLRDARAEFNAARGDVIDVWNARRQARAKTVYR